MSCKHQTDILSRCKADKTEAMLNTQRGAAESGDDSVTTSQYTQSFNTSNIKIWISVLT